MAIYHAIIMQQRVMFVGYNQAANDIASLVMSAVGMVSPPLSHHMLVNRTFPYANLSDLKFLEVIAIKVSDVLLCGCHFSYMHTG